MKLTNLIASMALVMLLAACSTPQERAARVQTQRTTDNTECSGLGFNPGTEGFADCLLRLKEIRAQEARTRALNNTQRNAFGPWRWPHQRYRYPYWY